MKLESIPFNEHFQIFDKINKNQQTVGHKFRQNYG